MPHPVVANFVRLQEKIQQKKLQRAAEEKQADIEREKNRVKQGKEAQVF